MTILQNTTEQECQEHVDSIHGGFDLTFLPIRKIFTLIFIHDQEHDQLLLGQKQRGPLLGQWNGFGGKVEKGLESTNDSAARELQEEAFVKAPLFPIGFIQWVVSRSGDIDPEDKTVYPYRDIMVVYKSHSLELCSSDSDLEIVNLKSQSSKRITEFKASDEMAPRWWDVDALPWEFMRVNHKVWYPFMLADRPYRGVYWYDTTLVNVEADQDSSTKKDNAQRENAKEVWVEDLEKRCVEFGTQPVGNMPSVQEKDMKLSEYAAKLGLSGVCYSTSIEHADQHTKVQSYPEPTPNRNLDEAWMKAAIAQAENEWIHIKIS
ncbi:hypothetical protein BGZ76_000470 [Entomortierella beljakovae]|nr:hypothetical protein BGZ76_000470 [Entomortierella beljakovae]